MSDSLQPRELQHASLLCPSLFLWVCSNLCSLSQWCHPTVSSSVAPFSCPQSLPTSESFPVSQLFASGGQSIGASASVLPMNIQGWFPLGLTGLISLAVQGTLKSLQHHSSKASVLQPEPFLVPLSHPIHDYWKNHSFDYMNLCRQSDVSAYGTKQLLQIATLVVSPATGDSWGDTGRVRQRRQNEQGCTAHSPSPCDQASSPFLCCQSAYQCPVQTLMASLLPKEVYLAGKKHMLVLKMQESERKENLIHFNSYGLRPLNVKIFSSPKTEAVSAFWRHSSVVYISFALSTNSYGLNNFICQPSKWQHSHFPLCKLTKPSVI